MKKLIIIIVILVILGGIVYYLSLRGKAPQFQVTSPIEEEIKIEEQKSPAKVDKLQTKKNNLFIQARVFIERYGSWSNQSNFENFIDLMPYMTEKLKAETQNLISQYQASKIQHPEYYGITTNVISLELKDFIADERAEFSASIQQQETKDSRTNILYKTANLIFLKVEGEWKADYINID